MICPFFNALRTQKIGLGSRLTYELGSNSDAIFYSQHYFSSLPESYTLQQ